MGVTLRVSTSYSWRTLITKCSCDAAGTLGSDLVETEPTIMDRVPTGEGLPPADRHIYELWLDFEGVSMPSHPLSRHDHGARAAKCV